MKNVFKKLWIEMKNRFRWVIVVLVLVVAVVLLPFLSKLLFCYWKWGLELEVLQMTGMKWKEFYATMITAFGAIGVVYTIWQNQKQTRDNRFVNNFAKSAESLASKRESTRLGGIYSLCFLAKTYPEDYKDEVFSILCGHVRSKTAEKEYEKTGKEMPSTEIRALLTLLFGKKSKAYKWSGEAYLDGCYLQKAHLSKMNLNGAKFFKANLKKADFKGADLKGAKFFKANLEGADFKGADLEGAKFFKAELRGADFGVYLDENQSDKKTNLIKAWFKGAYLKVAKFFKALFKGADLNENQSVKKTNLKGANFKGADLRGAKFKGANLEKADFGMFLEGAMSKETNLKGVNFEDANLVGANLVGANLVGATYNDNTRFPKGFDHTKYGMIEKQ